MAMNGDILGNAIATAINGLDLKADPPPSTEDIWKTVGNIIVDHIKANAVLTVSTTHAMNTINVAGTAAAQTNPAPVTSSTGSGTIA